MPCHLTINKHRNTFFALMSTILGGLIMCLPVSLYALDQRELDSDLKYVLLPKSDGLKPFQLTDQSNRVFGLDNLKGYWTFLYFGYTSCPDVCPMTTDELNIVYKKLDTHAQYKKDTRFVFVSVDPYRDTPELLKNFTSYFPFQLTGVVAPVESLNKLTEQLGVFHRRLIVEDRETQERQYAVEHSSDIYLISPDGKPVAKFPAPHYGKEIKELYVKIREMIIPSSKSI